MTTNHPVIACSLCDTQVTLASLSNHLAENDLLPGTDLASRTSHQIQRDGPQKMKATTKWSHVEYFLPGICVRFVAVLHIDRFLTRFLVRRSCCTRPTDLWTLSAPREATWVTPWTRRLRHIATAATGCDGVWNTSSWIRARSSVRSARRRGNWFFSWSRSFSWPFRCEYRLTSHYFAPFYLLSCIACQQPPADPCWQSAINDLLTLKHRLNPTLTRNLASSSEKEENRSPIVIYWRIHVCAFLSHMPYVSQS